MDPLLVGQGPGGSKPGNPWDRVERKRETHFCTGGCGLKHGHCSAGAGCGDRAPKLGPGPSQTILGILLQKKKHNSTC